jgi:adenylosuccinate lyase
MLKTYIKNKIKKIIKHLADLKKRPKITTAMASTHLLCK